MMAVTADTVLFITVPATITSLGALIGVLWRSGTDKGREDERYVDTDRRLTRLQRRIFNGADH
jgi:hypothetical protein